MVRTIKILYANNNPDDHSIILNSLSEGEYRFQITTVTSGIKFEKELLSIKYNIILCDYKLSGYQDFQTLDYINSKFPNIPFIVLANNGSEDIAVEAYKRGASGYLTKKPEHLKSFPSIIKNIIKLEERIRQKEELIYTLHESESRFRNIFDNATYGMLLASSDTKKFLLCNPYMSKLTGYTMEEIVTLSVKDIHPEESLKEIIEDFEKQLREEIATVHNIPVKRKDGTIFFADINSFPIKWEGNKCLMGVFTDMTDQKEAEDKLRENEEKYRQLIDTTGTGYVILDVQGVVNEANEEYVKLTGHTEFNEIRNRSVVEWTSETEKEKNKNAIDECIKKGFIRNLELDYVNRNGKITTVEINATVIIKGGKKHILSLCRDITERKQTEKALRENKKQLSALLNASTQPIMLLDMEGTVLAANTAMAQRLNVSVNNFIGSNAFQYLPDEMASSRMEKIHQVKQSGKAIRFEDQRKGRIFDNNIYPIIDDHGKASSVAIFSNDITENKKAVELQYQSLAQLRQIIDLVPHLIYAKNRLGKFILANAATAEVYGTSVTELIGKTDADFNKNQYQVKKFLKDDKIVLDSGELLEIPEEKITDSKGKLHYLNTIKMPLHLPNTSEEAILGVSTDITERKLAEEYLQQSEKRYRLLHESITDAFVEVNMDGKISKFNNTYINMLGYSAEEIVNLTYIDLTPEKWHNFESQIVNEQIIPRGYSDVYEKEYRRKDGTVFPIELKTFLVKDDNGNPLSMWALIRDITERKHAEEQLGKSLIQMRQLSARLQSIREEESTRIAREIHDELGQTLTGIKMDIAFLEECLLEKLDLKDNPVLEDKINSISDLADSAVQTIRKITTELRPVILDSMGLSAAIEWQAEEFQHHTGIICRFNPIGESLNLDKDISTAIFRIIQESLTNISRHAKATDVQIHVTKNKNHVIFEIKDNGIGIDEKYLHKLDSFGILGMKERAMVAGGEFHITTAPGKGTTIRVSIPTNLSSDRSNK
ncbi:MAG: PAS domain S-box protein [Ignavibacteriales bacterium]|nr:PAS domain S-box protein [Ignavibacteriales bacterium]